MSEITLCKTNRGKGLKAVINGTWFYTSWGEFNRMMSNKANGCRFRSAEAFKAKPGAL